MDVVSPHEIAPWTRRVDRLLARAAREVRLLGAVTPVDVERERARVEAAFAAGRDARPDWRYARAPRTDARELAAAALRELQGAGGPLAEAYAARAAEIDLEARLAEAAGTPELAVLATERFATRDRASADAASVLAGAWIDAPAVAPPRTRASDAMDPRSLLSRMRAAVGAHRLPFKVVPYDGLAPLAATGDRTILVATRREVGDEDVERTVLHEIEGHALPRQRAAEQPIGLFAIGTARGSDDQEGFALVLEERAGFSRAERRRQLASRHVAVSEMLDGATFVDVVRSLLARGAAARDAVLVAERAFRGGDGTTAGLGRERVYLPSFVRVRAHLAIRPADEAVLSSGQVALDAVDAMRTVLR